MKSGSGKKQALLAKVVGVEEWLDEFKQVGNEGKKGIVVEKMNEESE